VGSASRAAPTRKNVSCYVMLCYLAPSNLHGQPHIHDHIHDHSKPLALNTREHVRESDRIVRLVGLVGLEALVGLVGLVGTRTILEITSRAEISERISSF
jgi:hypothetical protein